MPPEDIPENEELSYPCETEDCYGNIRFINQTWQCDHCEEYKEPNRDR